MQVTDTPGELLIDYRKEREKPDPVTSIAGRCSILRFLIT